MKVWTIHEAHVWDALNANGVWRAHRERVDGAATYPWAYGWLRRQLAQRIGPCADDAQMPVWVWVQYRDPAHRRPDLRRRGHLPPGRDGVRIELEVAPERILQSDFELWHFALNYWYLAQSQDDDDDFEQAVKRARLCYYLQKPLPDPRLHARMESSWEYIFELGAGSDYLGTADVPRTIQGVMWEMRLDDVTGHTLFRAR